MNQTPHFNFDYLLPEQAQKHVTLNDALRRLDGLVHLAVISSTQNTPPSKPSNGARYMVGAQAIGAWSGRDASLALYEDTAWHFFTPRAGWRVWDEQTATLLVFDGKLWQPINMGAAQGGGEALVRRVTAEVNMTDAELATIPSHSIFLGVSARVSQQIVGPVSWDFGVAKGLTRFGNSLPLAQGSEIRGPADPSIIYWQPTPLLATPKGGTFTAGRLLLSLFYIDLPVPQAEDID